MLSTKHTNTQIHALYSTTQKVKRKDTIQIVTIMEPEFYINVRQKYFQTNTRDKNGHFD